ncbi:polyprotein [Elysia marginata]|uniref:Polyprotein n=1 Tax=Elysia marginata TaxID=1093978 RepID=A0AAV4IFF1_9GAST|nr:polyprotein [Elysia marginata]
MTNSSQSSKSLAHLEIWARHVSWLKPKKMQCRRMPFALEGKAKSEIENLVNQGTLAPVTKSTEWVSSEIFLQKLGEALEGLHNTINVADDIVLAGCGKTDAESKANLESRTKELKQRCVEKNIVLNQKKTVLDQKQVVFMGHLATADGISPDPAKVEAIQTLPAVRCLCGTVQYLARYIPNLSEHLEPLRALTRNKADWNWTKECKQAFENIKILWSTQQSCPILTT